MKAHCVRSTAQHITNISSYREHDNTSHYVNFEMLQSQTRALRRFEMLKSYTKSPEHCVNLTTRKNRKLGDRVGLNPTRSSFSPRFAALRPNTANPFGTANPRIPSGHYLATGPWQGFRPIANCHLTLLVPWHFGWALAVFTLLCLSFATFPCDFPTRTLFPCRKWL